MIVAFTRSTLFQLNLKFYIDLNIQKLDRVPKGLSRVCSIVWTEDNLEVEDGSKSRRRRPGLVCGDGFYGIQSYYL